MADNSAFISYRRETGYPWARLVWDGLRDRSVDAFFDLESLRVAGRFDDRLLNQIAARPYFIPILTHGTLERCAQPDDWLRREVEHAIATRRIIVPLFIEPFRPSDFPSTLPEHVGAALSESNGLTIYSQYLEPALDQLVTDRLQPVEIASLPLTADDADFQIEVEERLQELPPPTVPVTPTVDPQADRPTTLHDPVPPSPAPAPMVSAPSPPPQDDAADRRRLVPIVAGATAVVLAIVIAAVVFRDDDPPPVADPTEEDTQPEVSSFPPGTVTPPVTTAATDPVTTPAPPADGCDAVLSRSCVDEGETRDDVQELQAMLDATEFGSLAIDGQFGPNTESALVSFEARCSTCNADGQVIVDGDEWRRLEQWVDVGLVQRDRDALDALADNWVVQVAAYGTCLNPDNPFDPTGVRGRHVDFDEQLGDLGGAALASGDELNLHTDGGSGCYFSLLARTFDSVEAARQFCDTELAGACIPKFVSTDPAISPASGP